MRGMTPYVMYDYTVDATGAIVSRVPVTEPALAGLLAAVPDTDPVATGTGESDVSYPDVSLSAMRAQRKRLGAARNGANAAAATDAANAAYAQSADPNKSASAPAATAAAGVAAVDKGFTAEDKEGCRSDDDLDEDEVYDKLYLSAYPGHCDNVNDANSGIAVSHCHPASAAAATPAAPGQSAAVAAATAATPGPMSPPALTAPTLSYTTTTNATTNNPNSCRGGAGTNCLNPPLLRALSSSHKAASAFAAAGGTITTRAPSGGLTSPAATTTAAGELSPVAGAPVAIEPAPASTASAPNSSAGAASASDSAAANAATANVNVVLPLTTFRVGFLGVCTVHTPTQSYPTKDVIFDDSTESAARQAGLLRNVGRCDVVVALTHLSLTEDVQVLQAVPGVRWSVYSHF